MLKKIISIFFVLFFINNSFAEVNDTNTKSLNQDVIELNFLNNLIKDGYISDLKKDENAAKNLLKCPDTRCVVAKVVKEKKPRISRKSLPIADGEVNLVYEARNKEN